MDFVKFQVLYGKGYSLRKISTLLGVSRNTLKKYLSRENVTPSSNGDGHSTSKLKPYLFMLHNYLKEDPRFRSMEIFRRLQNLGYAGGYDLVRKEVFSIRKNVAAGPSEGNLRPGQRAVVDIGMVRTHFGNSLLFSMKLLYSERLYVVLVNRMDMQSFIKCHIQAFRYFPGVPDEISYDWLDNKYIRRLTGGPRINLPFLQFAEHYGFEIRAAPRQIPWAEGRMKRPCRLVQGVFLPTCAANGLDDCNQLLLNWISMRYSTICELSTQAQTRHENELARLKSPPSDYQPKQTVKLRKSVRITNQLLRNNSTQISGSPHS